MADQPTLSRPGRNPGSGEDPSNLRDRHELGAQIARDILLGSAPTVHRGFRPLAAGIFDLAEQLGRVGGAGIEALR